MSVTNKDTMYSTEEEQWRPIKGFISPRYYISNLGRVYVNGKRQQYLKPSKHPNTSSLQFKLYDGVNKKYIKKNLKGLMNEYFHYEFIKHLEDDEECKELIDHPGYYVTSKGRVWSSFTQKFRTIKKTNYMYYHDICIKNSHYLIHTLVGRTFLKDYKPGLIILHKNENLDYPHIHHLDNLEVGTYKDNVDDMINKCRDNFWGNKTIS